VLNDPCVRAILQEESARGSKLAASMLASKPATPATPDELARHELQGRLELLANDLKQIERLAGVTAFLSIEINARNSQTAARAAASLVRRGDRTTSIAEAARPPRANSRKAK